MLLVLSHPSRNSLKELTFYVGMLKKGILTWIPLVLYISDFFPYSVFYWGSFLYKTFLSICVYQIKVDYDSYINANILCS